MKKTMKLTASIVAISLLFGCTNGGPKQTSGTYIGAVGGALLGSQFGKGSGKIVSAALGTFIGSMFGSEIGKGMDERDRELASNTINTSLESSPDHQVRTWHNPNNDHRGNFVVTRTIEEPYNNKVCRDYVHTVIIDGKQEQVAGRACRDVRDPRTQWTVVN